MGSIVRKIDAGRGARVRAGLEAEGWEIRPQEHAHWAASGPGITVVHYKSGKFLVQGKHADDFMATWFEELGLLDDGASPGAPSADTVTEPIIGVDESGKGDYFGPLVIAGFLVRPEDVPVLRLLGARDSKEVGDAEALRVAEEIEDAWPGHSAVVAIGPARYNEMHREFGGNLNRLLAWGHATVVEKILEHIPCGRMISDQFGDPRLVKDALTRKKIEIRLEQRPRAESHPAVAAASILARAKFLRELRRLGDVAGVKLPKGAGTPVDAAARAIFRERGIEGLEPVAKMHFRTTLKARELL
ncbi:MAG: ribonuclease HIII [Planctomycetes bacterium]|nr:ribonuclease HIII [Planctomycetota bacterium]